MNADFSFLGCSWNADERWLKLMNADFSFLGCSWNADERWLKLMYADFPFRYYVFFITENADIRLIKRWFFKYLNEKKSAYISFNQRLSAFQVHSKKEKSAYISVYQRLSAYQ